MSLRGCHGWPPHWIRIDELGDKKRNAPEGEVGFLKEVRYSTTPPGRIFLMIDHEGENYVGRF
jgi:hypothetical protein